MSAPPVAPCAEAPERRVPCPACAKPCVFAPVNRWRPFCSARCAGADLGAWASESYRVAAPPSPDDVADGQAPEATH